MNDNNELIKKIDRLYDNKNISNIIFHGNNLTGKKTILEYLLYKIYKNKENIEKYVLIINCCHGKGNIKFIRENMKFFANVIISNKDNLFKSIVLLNADRLTIDAQSALRRSIEIYNHTTRFFIVVDNKFKILKPILSRFSEIFCNKRIIIKDDNKDNYTNNKITNLKKYIDILDYSNKSREIKLEKIYEIINLSKKLYNEGYSGNNLIKFIELKLSDNFDKYNFLFMIDNFKKEIRNEIIIILFCLYFIYFRNNIDIKNIRTM
tara:strand:- start:2700 stop:3491 length:792 start_codon:yes stop_codon:yes gene_type:complete